MPRPAPRDYLQPDETPIASIGRTTISVIDEMLAIGVLCAIVILADTIAFMTFLPNRFPTTGVPVIVVVALLGAVWCTVRWWHTRTSLYTLTDQRLYKAHGRFRWFLLQTTFDKVTDLHVRQGIFGRLWGYGTIRVETAGVGLVMEGVHDPWQFKQTIESARSLFLSGLRHDAAPAERPAGMGEPLWAGPPVVAAIVPRIIFAGALAFVGLLTGAAILFSDGGPSAALGLVFFLFAGVQCLLAWVFIRFTVYHIYAGGVVVTSGWLTRKRVEATFTKVTDVETTQGVLGRLLGFGDIRINTAGSNEAPIVFAGIGDPEQLKLAIDRARGVV